MLLLLVFNFLSQRFKNMPDLPRTLQSVHISNTHGSAQWQHICKLNYKFKQEITRLVLMTTDTHLRTYQGLIPRVRLCSEII
jgi:hypothetical protein